jgi:cathepsin C
MVYDEGFNMEFEDLSFFAFSKYSIDRSTVGKTHYNSHCFSTCVGWYHNKNQSKWGCYRARRIDVKDDLQVTMKDTKNNMNVVEPVQSLESSLINTVFNNMHFRSVKTDITFNEDSNKTPEKDSVNKLKKTRGNKFLNKKNTNGSSFLEIKESEKSMMTLSSSFKNHALYLLKLKNLKKNWEAHLTPEFSHMTIKELNKFAGISRSSNRQKAKSTRNGYEDLSGFPKSFDWKDKLRAAGSQGSCGSCYVYSTVRMLEARLKIKYSHEAKLSVQHPLDCNIYNQGCDGGYPFLVMKFSSEYELIPEMCKPYLVINLFCFVLFLFNLIFISFIGTR